MAQEESKIDKMLAHWAALHKEGIHISPDKRKILVEKGLIEIGDPIPPKKQHRVYARERKDFTVKVAHEKEADKNIDIIRVSGDKEIDDQPVVVTDRTKWWDHGLVDVEYSGTDSIIRKDWIPYKESIFEPDDDFIKLIDSILLLGFSNHIYNKKFSLYKQQAKDWLSDNDSISNYATPESKKNFIRKERDRVRENSLYGLNKYLYLKEDSEASGQRKFEAYDVQAFIMWLIDCGFSLLIGKMRQIGFSSVIGALAEQKARVNRNFFVKFIAENDRKTEEIFDDKIKHSLYVAPGWFKPTVHNEAANLLTYVYKKKKGETLGLNSKIMVEPPYLTAINGGSPSIVLIDEIGQIPELSGIILEGRPTLFYVDPLTKKMRVRRQFVGWGTSGNNTKGGGAFEVEFRTAVDNWKKRKFSYGLIPIFVDAFSKPGVDMEFYQQEMETYYDRAAKDPMKSEELKAQFHTAYPVDLEDMFMSTAKLLIGVPEINRHLDRIRRIKAEDKPVWGYFEPKFDKNFPMPENSEVPFRIIGSNWVPTEDFSPLATTLMSDPPDLDWKWRYYQGTDPINSATGYSNFASTIWDEQKHKVACQINFREKDFKICYQQALLMNLYYGRPMHLIEYNIGQALIDYIESHSQYGTIVTKDQLVEYLRSGGSDKGIRKTTANAKLIINKLIELLSSYIDNIDVEEFFVQLKTFHEKVSKNGETTYSTSNPLFYKDDIIDSVTYAYICALSFSKFHQPKSNEDISTKRHARKKYMYENGKVVLKNKYGGNNNSLSRNVYQ